MSYIPELRPPLCSIDHSVRVQMLFYPQFPAQLPAESVVFAIKMNELLPQPAAERGKITARLQCLSHPISTPRHLQKKAQELHKRTSRREGALAGANTPAERGRRGVRANWHKYLGLMHWTQVQVQLRQDLGGSTPEGFQLKVGETWPAGMAQ